MSFYPRPTFPDLLRDFDSAIVIAPFHWNFTDGLPGTTHHIARELARALPTLFLEPPVVWDPRSEQFRLARLSNAVAGRRTRSPEPNLTVFHRRSLPLGRLTAVRHFDLARNIRALTSFLKVHSFARPLVWHSFPYGSESIIDSLTYKCLVYHCLDHTAQALEEARIIKSADFVFCVSETLVAKHRPINRETYLLPNGVDLDLFDRDRAQQAPRPADLPASGRVIGFLGSINHHLDLELLLKVSEHYSDDTLVLVGKVATRETAPTTRQLQALEQLRHRANVRLLGFKPTLTLPLYINASDVCLIPFLEDSFNKECDPLKFYEYAALGKPVVATDVPVARRYSEFCYRASSHADFIDLISRAFEEPDSVGRQEGRVVLARSHGWPSLLTNALRVVDQTHVSPGGPR